jgi:hypothetical protein
METTPDDLNNEHVEILSHTLTRAAGQRYCGDSKEMKELCDMGLMRSLGRVSWVRYHTIQ